MIESSSPPADRPVILVVDDDPQVLRAVVADMRRQYGGRFRIVEAGGGAEALAVTRQLLQRGDDVALFVVDQRMPGMTGVEFIAEARQLYPDARRVLLTGYADMSAAIEGINEAGLHHYFEKPWHPPEEKVYPMVTDLLEDWQNTRVPVGWEGVKIVGHRWSPAANEIKEFLTLNQVPYSFLDLDSNTDAAKLLSSLDTEAPLPVVFFEDGEWLSRPTPRQLAEKTRKPVAVTGSRVHDLAIVGAGPAGLAAAVYGSSEGLDTVVVERWAPGGQAGTTSQIMNYLGFPSGISGADLVRRAGAQAAYFGAQVIITAEASGLRVDGPVRTVTLTDGTEIRSRAILISTGMTTKTIEAPGFAELVGRGIYYGATVTDVFAYKDEDVVVVGGANSAGQAAVRLSERARLVRLVVRGESLALRMSRYLVDQIEERPNIEVMTRSEVVGAEGDDHLAAVVIADRVSGTETRLPASAIFVLIGAVPHSQFLRGVVALSPEGFVLTGPDLLVDGKPPPGWPLRRPPFFLETSVPGVFAAGDVRRGSIRRVAAAVGAGSAALSFIHEYLDT